MKVMVTGGFGFLGRRLIRRLLNVPGVSRIVRASRRAVEGHPLLEFDCGGPWVEDECCDLTHEPSVRAMMARCKPDVVFHLAATSVVRKDEQDPFAITRNNVLATHHLLEHCPAGCRFVLASSATVYGDQALNANEKQRLSPSSVYGASKAAAECLVRAHHALGKVSGIFLRLTACVGAGATHGVVRDLLAKLLSSSRELEVLGDEPGSCKHYLHVDDAAEAFVRLGMNRQTHGAYNVATPDVLTIGQLARVLMDEFGVHKPIRWLGESANWKGDNRVVIVDSRKANQAGWSPACARSEDAVRTGARDMAARKGKRS